MLGAPFSCKTGHSFASAHPSCNDGALERYLAGQVIDLAGLRRLFVESMNRGHVVPILFTAATREIGVDDLLHVLVEEAPSPVTARPRRHWLVRHRHDRRRHQRETRRRLLPIR